MDMGDKAKEFLDKAKDVFEDVKDKAEDAFEHAKETFAKDDAEAKDKLHEAGTDIKDEADKVGHAIKEDNADGVAAADEWQEVVAQQAYEPNDLADASELNPDGTGGFETDSTIEHAEAAIDNPENPVP